MARSCLKTSQILGRLAGTMTVMTISRVFAPSVFEISTNSRGTDRTWSATSVVRNHMTPRTRNAIFCVSPAPSHIRSKGMNAGAGRYRAADTSGDSSADTTGKQPIAIPNGTAIAAAMTKLMEIRDTLVAISLRNPFCSIETSADPTSIGEGRRRGGASSKNAAPCQTRRNARSPATPSTTRQGAETSP